MLILILNSIIIPLKWLNPEAQSRFKIREIDSNVVMSAALYALQVVSRTILQLASYIKGESVIQMFISLMVFYSVYHHCTITRLCRPLN